MNYSYMILDKLNKKINKLKSKYPSDVLALKLKEKFLFNDNQITFILENAHDKLSKKDLLFLYELSNSNLISKHYDYVEIIDIVKKETTPLFICSIVLLVMAILLTMFCNDSQISGFWIFIILSVLILFLPICMYLHYRKILQLKNKLSKDNIELVDLKVLKCKYYYFEIFTRFKTKHGLIYYGIDQNGKRRKLIYPKCVKINKIKDVVHLKVINDVVIK